MKKFKTQYDARERRVANPGSRIHETFVGSFDDKGRISLKKSGQENIYDKIQSHKLSCDINYIVKRFTEGDVDVLSKVQGFYGDFRGMPTNYAQLLNTVEDGKRLFDSLPAETKEIFNNNVNEFMAAIVDGTLLQKINPEKKEAKSVDKEDSAASSEE